MRYLPKDKVFRQSGSLYIVKSPSRRGWPCQSCDLSELCGNGCWREDWPACRAQDRQDGEDVVFRSFRPESRHAARRERSMEDGRN